MTGAPPRTLQVHVTPIACAPGEFVGWAGEFRSQISAKLIEEPDELFA
jgi:hypothetical protein